MRAAIVAVTSALVLFATAIPFSATATTSLEGGSLTFSVGSLSCANATARINVSGVNVSVLYLNTSDTADNSTNGTQTGNYYWTAGTNYTEDTRLPGSLTVLVEAMPPPQCPWAGKAWLDWSNVSQGSLVEVDIVFAPGPPSTANGSWVTGNSSITVPLAAPAFPFFLQLVGLGTFCIFLYWSIRSWRKVASLVDGEVEE